MTEQAGGIPASLQERPPGYAEWLADLKLKVQAAQQRASLAVNQELLRLYWQIGNDILARQADAEWGSRILDQVSADLRAAFPEMKGFSRTNLKYMRAFAEAWPQLGSIGQQPVDQLTLGVLQDSKNALRDAGRPIGVAEYQLVEALPKDLEASLLSVERIERELRGMEEMLGLLELLDSPKVLS